MGLNTRKTVHIRKGVTLQGKYVDGARLTIVQGGGSLAGFLPDKFVGPFKVESHWDWSHPVILDGLWMRDWISEAVFVVGCHGFTLTRSKVTHPIGIGMGFPLMMTNYVHGILALHSTARGHFYVTNNEFNMTTVEGPLPDDNNAVSLYGFPRTAFSKIVLEDNLVYTPDEAFELLSNDPSEPCDIRIRNNEIHVDFDVVEGGWPEVRKHCCVVLSHVLY